MQQASTELGALGWEWGWGGGALRLSAGILGGRVHIYLLDYTQQVTASFPQKLLQLYSVVQGRAQLGHSSPIVKVGVEVTC